VINIVESLKKQHIAIGRRLEELQNLPYGSGQMFKALMSAKTMLLEHLSLEDRELYPKLDAMAKTDLNVQAMLGVFRTDMSEVTKLAIAFFEKYENKDNASGIDFARDVGALVARLKMRLALEESQLYAAYLKGLETPGAAASAPPRRPMKVV
jgi:hypothetical protein